MTVANNTSLCSTILVVFLEFIPVDWAEIPLIIWLALGVGKMNRLLRCDWLPEQARWSYFARLGLPTVSRKKNKPKSHTINPLLTKLFC